ncbi:MAG: YgjP-like metallopeptidase domain-containing protein [Bacilli bacterium]|jgi:predicted metal-dependent hydrolase
MQMHHFSITENGQLVTYTLELHYKRMRSVIFRSVEGENLTFKVSLPYGTKLDEVERIFLKNRPKLMRLQDKSKVVPFNDSTYVFGQKMTQDAIAATFHLKHVPMNLDDFYQLMKKTFISHLTTRVRFYESRMTITTPYKIRVRKMKTRWATNSKKTFTLTFNEKVIHFHPDIIDALIVHELGHHFIGGHGPNFYTYLETIYPHYRHYDYMLKEHHYEGHYQPSKPKDKRIIRH